MTTTLADDTRITKLATMDAETMAEELCPNGDLTDLIQAVEAPGQLGASEGLCTALGLAGTAKYLGVPLTESREELHAASAVYDRVHAETLAFELAERRAGKEVES